MFAEVIGEMILELGEAQLVLLLGAPFLVTAASAPVGDVAFGDGDAALAKCPDDFGIGNMVMEEFVDHVAFEFGQAGDLAFRTRLPRRTEGGGVGGCRLGVAGSAGGSWVLIIIVRELES